MSARSFFSAAKFAPALMGLALLSTGIAMGDTDIRRGPANVSPFHSDRGDFYGGTICNAIARFTRPLQTELVQGEPLIVEILLHSAEDVGLDRNEFQAQLQIGSDLRVYISPPHGRSFEYRPMRVNPLGSNTVVPLTPGEFASSYFVMAYDPESISGAVFEEAGTYRIRVTLECRESGTPQIDTGIEVGTFEVTVRAPESESDQVLGATVGYDYHEFFRSFQLMQPQNQRDAGIMQRVLEDGRDSRHAPFALLALAESKFVEAFALDEEGADLSTPSPGLAAAQQARELYRQFKRDYPRHPLAANAHLRLFRIALMLDEEEEAFALFREAWVDPRLNILLIQRGSEYSWMFGPQDEPEPPVSGPWALFENPRHAMDPAIYQDPDEPVPMTEEEMMREAMMEAIREGRFEVRQMEGPPPGYE